MSVTQDCCFCQIDTGGYHEFGCPEAVTTHPGVWDAWALQVATDCSMGRHEWLPWLRLDNGSFVTRCVHCERTEQWDT